MLEQLFLSFSGPRTTAKTKPFNKIILFIFLNHFKVKSPKNIISKQFNIQICFLNLFTIKTTRNKDDQIAYTKKKT